MRRQQIQEAAYSVATQTREVEDVIEAAMVELAELQTRMLRVSGVAGVGYEVFQQSFESVAATIKDLVTARGAMAQCHLAMAQAKEKVPGLRTVSFGDEGSCPKTAVADLRIVA